MSIIRNLLFYIVIFIMISIVAFNNLEKVHGRENMSKKLDNKFTVSSGTNKGNKVQVYDGTIEKYNGYYYLIGTGSKGKVYRSKDMIRWESPYELISDDPSTLPPYANENYPKYDAPDLLFHNGVMFFGFNENNLVHGDPSTMNSTPDFQHSFWDKPFDTGIDLQFVVSHDGELLYIRKVQPFENDPNTGNEKNFKAAAWMWNVKSFFNEKGNPDRGPGHELLHTQKGHWDSFDKFNFEGPEMYYHNGQYYLLYMGNNMAPRTGRYETGVAQAENYNEFDNSKKYPGKLIARNLERMLLTYDVILSTSEHGSQSYQYTFTEPQGDWQSPNYHAVNWNIGQGGFGYPLRERDVLIPSIYNDGKVNLAEIWGHESGPENIWVRREFDLVEIPETAVLRLRMEGYGEVYINNEKVHRQQGQQRSYQMIEVPSSSLRKGKNVITARVSTNGPKVDFYHIDFGLFDTNGELVEADIVGPTQPNVIKGPNGFETWVTYKALWDGDNGQGKDRVYFWDDEMIVDGPTSGNSPNHHFDAWQPTFRDQFDDQSSLNAYINHNDVKIQESLYIDTPAELKEILLKNYEIENLFFETNIRFDNGEGAAGVTVWHKDKNNYVRLIIDRDNNTYIISYMIDGDLTADELPLPDTFDFIHNDERVNNFGEQYHSLRVYKNGSHLFAELDHYKLNNAKPILVLDKMSTPGKVGIVCKKTKCSIDNLSLTVGWNEYGAYFNNWNKEWTSSENGLTSPSKENSMTVKGDPILEHEFSVNIDTGSLPNVGKAGVVLEYIDDENYVMAYTDYAKKQFEIYKVVGGKRELIETASTVRDVIYGNSNNNQGLDQNEFVYDLRAPAEVSEARILWLNGKIHLNNWIDKSYLLPDVDSENFSFDFLNFDDNDWNTLNYFYEWRGKGDYHVATFEDTIITEKIRMNVPSATQNRPFSFAVREEISAQNFYKTVRTDDRLYLWVNNKLIFDIEDPFNNREAQVGFYTDNINATYNSFIGFDISESPSIKSPETGKKLPKTSTNMYNLLLVGVPLLIASVVSFFRRKNKSSTNGPQF